MEQVKKAGYAIVGVYDLAYDKAKGFFEKARKTKRDDMVSIYQDLSKRGQKLMRSMQRSKPVKRATSGTKQATRQLKGAATSLKKATGTEEKAAS